MACCRPAQHAALRSVCSGQGADKCGCAVRGDGKVQNATRFGELARQVQVLPCAKVMLLLLSPLAAPHQLCVGLVCKGCRLGLLVVQSWIQLTRCACWCSSVLRQCLAASNSSAACCSTTAAGAACIAGQQRRLFAAPAVGASREEQAAGNRASA